MDEVLLKLEKEPNDKLRKLITYGVLLAIVLWSISGLDAPQAGKNGMTIVKSIFTGLFSPDWSLFALTKKGIPYLLLETMAIAFLGTIVGAIIAIPLAFLASPNIVPNWISKLTRLFLILIRTIPTLVWGLIFIRVTGPGPFAGLLTMGITSIAMITKLFSESIQDINDDILESLSALGMNTFQIIRYGIIPHLSATFLSTVIYRFDINIRDATVLGLVGAGGIGAPLIFAINGYKWNQVGALLLGLITLILIIEFFSTRLRSRLVKGF